MSTKSSVFHEDFRHGGEVHVYWEMDKGYYINVRIPFVMDVTMPVPAEAVEQVKFAEKMIAKEVIEWLHG